MPKTRRGGNRPERVTRSRRHKFSKTRAELEDMRKDELEELAKELGVYSRTPATGESDDPLKSDLVDHLAQYKNQVMT